MEGDHPACTSEARKAGDTAPDGFTYLAGARARPLVIDGDHAAIAAPARRRTRFHIAILGDEGAAFTILT